MGDVDRGFGRAIAVVQLHARQLFQQAVAQLGGQGFATGEHPTQAMAAGAERLVDEQLQQRRDKVQRGHAVLLHQLSDTVRVAMLAGSGNEQAAAGDQRPEAFPYRYVEADRGFLHQHIVSLQLVAVLHPLQALHQRGVGIADALGLAGGTGGVDHIGQVVAMQVQARGLARPVVELEAVHGDGADARGGWHALEQVGLGQQQLDAAVAEHVGQALGRVVRVQGYIGTAGLDDGQQADQQLRRTLGGDGHAHVGADPLVPQVVGQAVGLGVQLGKTQLATLPHQRGAFRGQLPLFMQPFRQPALGRRTGGHAPLLQLLGLCLAQERQVAQGRLRLLAGVFQQADEVSGQALDGRRFEQLVGIVEGQAQASVAIFLGVQLQVELGFAAVPRQLFGQQPGQAPQGTEVALLVVEHDLEQALLAGLGEGFQQLFERQVLIGLGPQGCLANLLQQLGEGLAPMQLAAQHLGVDEEAHQALGFQARAVGIGHPDADIALAGVAVQQGLEGCQQ